jgi:hypothetical protein
MKFKIKSEMKEILQLILWGGGMEIMTAGCGGT